MDPRVRAPMYFDPSVNPSVVCAELEEHDGRQSVVHGLLPLGRVLKPNQNRPANLSIGWLRLARPLSEFGSNNRMFIRHFPNESKQYLKDRTPAVIDMDKVWELNGWDSAAEVAAKAIEEMFDFSQPWTEAEEAVLSGPAGAPGVYGVMNRDGTYLEDLTEKDAMYDGVVDISSSDGAESVDSSHHSAQLVRSSRTRHAGADISGVAPRWDPITLIPSRPYLTVGPPLDAPGVSIYNDKHDRRFWRDLLSEWEELIRLRKEANLFDEDIDARIAQRRTRYVGNLRKDRSNAPTEPAATSLRHKRRISAVTSMDDSETGEGSAVAIQNPLGRMKLVKSVRGARNRIPREGSSPSNFRGGGTVMNPGFSRNLETAAINLQAALELLGELIASESRALRLRLQVLEGIAQPLDYAVCQIQMAIAKVGDVDPEEWSHDGVQPKKKQDKE